MHINENYRNLKESYLFSNIAKKVSEYSAAHPQAKLIRMGIGDVTLPLPKATVDAMVEAAREMGKRETFRGYGPEQGYGFLKESIAAYYARRGVMLDEHEIFVSDGAKSDLGNILDLFTEENVALIPDPVYPAYVDTNIMAGRRVLYMEANEGNGFLPLPDYAVDADIIYLCSPNNPTGAVYGKAALSAWVEYAHAKSAVIFFDAAYEAFIADPSLPRSIYEIPGAKSCAVEFCSFSKIAGFTGTRCGYTVVPKGIMNGELNRMWLHRQTTKFNGVPYIVQRGAAAALTEEGFGQCMANISYYKENARIMAEALESLSIWFTGGKNSPYIWLRCPNGSKSWDFFDTLLKEANVVGTPGAGFGNNGEGYFRLTAFGNREATVEAMERIKELLG